MRKIPLTLPYNAFIFTQYDSICLGRLPTIGQDQNIHVSACGPDERYEAKVALHPPWCMGKNVLRDFVKYASMEPIQIEGGVMDRWLPCVMQRHRMSFEDCDWAFSCNSIDCDKWIYAARKAISKGFLFIHGVKNKWQLESILMPEHSGHGEKP